jgi:hypothetical protein
MEWFVGTKDGQYTSRQPIEYITANTDNHHSRSPSSAKMSTEARTKKFQKGEAAVPSATDKALRYYLAEDEQVLKKVRYGRGLKHIDPVFRSPSDAKKRFLSVSRITMIIQRSQIRKLHDSSLLADYQL